jgi:Peptidase family S41
MSLVCGAGGVLAALLLPACSAFISVPAGPPPPPDEVLVREFTPEELAADLDDLFAIIEEVHPNPYTVVPRDEMLRRRAALVAGLDRPMLRREFQPRVAELVAALGDGHTTVYLPQDEWWRGPASTCFPIDVAWDGTALWVRHTAVVTEGGDLGVGARIISISGRPADELMRKFMAQRSGETEAFRAQGVELAFPMHLWQEGMESPWKLKFESAVQPGKNFSVDITGMSWNVVARGPAPATGERWRLERRDDGAAVLTIDTLAGDVGDFEDFLEATFEQLKEAPSDVLVIDLRRNGGGDSRLGDELLQYVAHKPWRQASRKEWKMSERYLDYFKTHLPAWIRWLPVQYLHPMGWQMWTTPEGECLIMDEELTEPRDEELRYDGPVAFLIGPGTFSSAKSLALAVKDCGLALLVGEPTGGVCNAFGEVYPFQLPRTRLGAQVSSALTVRPNGETSTIGPVEPDVLVRPAPGETGDVVLERAIEELRSALR